MESTWNSMLDFIFLTVCLASAALLKDNLKIFKKLVIPTSIIAGFIGLFFGPEFLKVIPFNVDVLGNMVYHLMAIGFIALALKERKGGNNPYSGKTGFYIVSMYLVQGIVGFGVTLILAATVMKKLFPAFGLLLPLGYGQGPGQAYSIGTQWEALGFESGSQIGLSVATAGFLWACLGGIILLNFLIKKRNMKHEHLETDEAKPRITEDSEAGEIPLSSGLDKITAQLFLIGIVYLVTFLTIKGLEIVLTPMGLFGQTLAQLFWGFHFLIGTVYAILLRVIYDKARESKVLKSNYPNNYLLQRISGACFDLMITASIAALSISAIKKVWLPLLIITTVGGLVTIMWTTFVCRRVFKEHTLEYILAFYGMLTGTISTALALLREVDSEFETGVAENLVFGSAIALPFGLPLMAILNIPTVGYVNNQPIMYIYTIGAFVLYLIFICFLLFKKNKEHEG
ncbi:sodium/glutamate symporter [Clostridium sp. DL1XJH146]